MPQLDDLISRVRRPDTEPCWPRTVAGSGREQSRGDTCRRHALRLPSHATIASRRESDDDSPASGRRPGRRRLASRRLAGAHARPADVFTAGYWTELVLEAERACSTSSPSRTRSACRPPAFSGQDHRTDQVRGRLDAVLIAARVAPLTRHIGLVPTALVTHTEPFHISKAIATLDYVSTGRAGRARPDLRPRGGERPLRPPAHPGVRSEGHRRTAKSRELISELFDEAADYVEVVRRLWDSWEDDAEIRDARHRPVHRPGQDPLHRLPRASTSRSRARRSCPAHRRGNRVVTALAHSAIPYRFAARSADVVYVTPTDAARAPARSSREVRRRAGPRGPGPARRLHVFADLVVFLDTDDRVRGRAQGPAGRARRRRIHLGRAHLHRHPPANWPTCSPTGSRPASPATGCGRAPCPTT